MNWRVAGFFVSAVLLLYYFGWLVWRRRTAQLEIPAPACEHWSWKQLILASFLTLFAELALIRWIGTEIRIFAYVKNLALLLCFLGFGMGCALARRPVRWRASATALLGLLMVVRWPWQGNGYLKTSLSRWVLPRTFRSGHPVPPGTGRISCWRF